MFSFCKAGVSANEFESERTSGVGHARFEARDVVVSVSVSVLGGRIVQLLRWHRRVGHHSYVMQLCGLMVNLNIPRPLCLYFDPLNSRTVSLRLLNKFTASNSHFPKSGKSILVIWP